MDPAQQGSHVHLRTGLLLTAIQLFGLVLVVIQEVFAAKLFGAHREMDGYLEAWIVPVTVATVLGSGLQNALIPHFARVRHNRGADEAWALAGETLGISLLLFTGCAIAGIVASPIVLPLVAASPATRTIAGQIYPIGFVFAGASLITSMLAGVCIACGRFVLPSILSNLSSLSPVLFLWVTGHLLGIFSLPIGLLVGALLQIIVLAATLLRLGLRLRLPQSGAWRAVKAVLRDAVAISLAAIPMGAIPVFERHLASSLGDGAVSHLFYASKLLSATTRFLSTGLAIMGLPLLSAYLARGEQDRFENVFSLLFRFATYLAVISILGLAFGGQDLIELLFERGRFGHPDTLAVATLLTWYGFVLIYSLLFPVVNAVVLTKGMAWILPVCNLIGCVIYLGVATPAAHSSNHPLVGLAVSYGLGFDIILLAVMVALLRRKLISAAPLLQAIRRALVLALAVGVPLAGLTRALHRFKAGPLLSVSILATAGPLLAVLVTFLVDREIAERLTSGFMRHSVRDAVRPSVQPQ